MASVINIQQLQLNQYNARLNSAVILSCMVASIGGVLSGYDIEMSGHVTTMDSFLRRFFPSVHITGHRKKSKNNYCRLHSYEVATFVSCFYIVGMFAAVVAAKITEKYGRRVTIMYGGIAYMIGSVTGGAALNFWMLCLGRMILGVGLGFTIQAIPLYISEIAPPQHRGKLMTIFTLNQTVGIQLANFVRFSFHDSAKSSYGWRILLLFPTIPATLLSIGTCFLSETPINMLQRGLSLGRAVGVLQRLRGVSEIIAELDDAVSACSPSLPPSPNHSLFQKKYTPELLTATAVAFFSQITGFNLIILYTPMLLQNSFGMDDQNATALFTLLAGVIGISSIIAAAILVDKVGRRPLFLIGGALMLIPHLRIGGSTGDARYLILLIMICIFVVGFQFSWAVLGWLVPSELFPIEVRSLGSTVVACVRCFGSVLMALGTDDLHCVLGFGAFLFFAMCVVVMTLFVVVLLPETKGVPMERMKEVVWRDHWIWRRFVQHAN